MTDEFCAWLSTTAMSKAFQNADWFVPLVQTVHILGVAVLATSIAMMSFRLIASSRGPRETEIRFEWISWSLAALAVLLVSGCLLVITEPGRELTNILFRVKMLLVVILAGVVVAIRRRLRDDAHYWTSSAHRRLSARVVGIACLLLGTGIITAGRWIAYI